MADILDSVRVNKRQQKLHVRSFRPQQSPVALLVWHHGEQAACLSWPLQAHRKYAAHVNWYAAGYGEHLLRYTHCESLACTYTHVAAAQRLQATPIFTRKFAEHWLQSYQSLPTMV